MNASAILESLSTAVSKAPVEFQEQLLAALGNQTGRMQEARKGKIVRVADMRYLREAKGKNALRVRLSPGVAKVAESLQSEFLDEDFDGWDKLADYCQDNHLRMGEATAASAFGQLERAGVQTIANDWYLRTAVSWTNYLMEYASSKRQEYHAPLSLSNLPQVVRPAQPYRESKVVGDDIELINLKFMGGESFESELWDDDQTGQIRQRAQSLGEAQRQLEEINATATIFGLMNFTVGNYIAYNSNYSTRNANGTVISNPYDANLYSTGNGNLLAANSVLNGSSLKAAFSKLMQATDQTGIRIVARPNHLVVSTSDALNAPVLLRSDFNATVQGVGGTTFNNQLGGTIGGPSSINAFKGLLDFSVNFFAPQWAWAIGTAKKGPVFQRRSPMEVLQEAPNSGQSFDNDVVRYRTRSRYITGWVNPRFWLRGNDGTAVGSY